MSIFKKHVSRRAVLKGIGASIALPLLDSMLPAYSAKAASASPVRLGYMYTPNGLVGACDKSPRPFMWTPKIMLRLMLGEVANVIATGQRVLPKKALARGYAFKFTNVEEAMKDAVQGEG